EGALPESDRWRYYEPMVPGSNPLLNLARILKPPKADESYVSQSGLLAVINPQHFAQAVASQTTSRAVIVVDQFEEIFTLCDQDRIRQAFSANLLNLLDADHVVILTMRADFETRVALLPELQPRFERAVQRVTPLSAAELREAIVAPAEIIGLKFEDGVVEALVQDILGEPAGLPLLQFTLLKLWEQRDHNRITWEAYQRSGGGRRALARAADEFFEHLIPEEQDTAKRILLKLVRPGEGLEVTSNRVRVNDLYHRAEASDRIDRVLARLIQARLVRMTEGDAETDAQVEVAHEALVRNWPRLVNWLEEERNFLRIRQRLTSAAEQWLQRGKDPSALSRGRLLEESLRYDDLTELETEYVRASVQAEEDEREAKHQAEQQALKAEMAEQVAELERQKARAQAQKAEIAERFAQEQQRTARVLQIRLWISRALIGVALLALAAAVYLGWQAFTAEQEARLQAMAAQNAKVTAEYNEQRAEEAAASAAYQEGQAQEQRDLAKRESERANMLEIFALGRQLAIQAQDLASSQPDLALLLGVFSDQVASTVDSQRAMLAALSSERPIPFTLGSLERVHTHPVQNVAFSLDSQTLATADTGGTLVFWDVSQRALAGPPLETSRPIYALAFSPAVATELITGGCQRLQQDECALVRYASGIQPRGVQLANRLRARWRSTISPSARMGATRPGPSAP
ncbi:MAG: nSTAND1 domain-containing NTPase, partial [Anaerolineales bacterium]